MAEHLINFNLRTYAKKLQRLCANKPLGSTIAIKVAFVQELIKPILESTPAKAPIPVINARPGLTDAQTKVYEAIVALINKEEPTTLRSIAEACGYKAHNSARVIVNKLLEVGYIIRDDKGNLALPNAE